jgi:hypothetical protein
MDVADVFILILGYTSYEAVAEFHKSQTTKRFTVVHNMCVSLNFNLLRTTFLAPRILRQFLDFWEIF